MKKAKLLILPLVAAATMLTACSEGAVNQGPELRGVADITCIVDTAVDLLDGVVALDTEQGDITPDLKITVTPSVEVTDGYAVFPETGEYEVCYEIRDNLGKLARTTAYATVIDREVYSEGILANGFSLKTGGSAQVIKDGLSGSRYVFETAGANLAEDVGLVRTCTMICGKEYTFKYFYNSSVAGKITFAVGGNAVAESYIGAGNVVSEFTCSLPYKESGGEVLSETVEIALWLGELGDAEISLEKAEAAYKQEGELLENFNFTGRLENRDNKAQGVYASADGKEATLEVTNPTGNMWEVGMFIDTGLDVVAGGEYTVSFDAEAAGNSDYEIFLLFGGKFNDGDDSGAVRLFGAPKAVSERLTAQMTEAHSGRLYISVRSGKYSNKITVKNLSIRAENERAGTRFEYYDINGFYTNNGDDKAVCENGKVTYSVKRFGADNWGNTELHSPSFPLQAAGKNIIITFKAKATKNVRAVLIATRADKWDTFVWSEIRITKEEQNFAIRCDNKGLDGTYKFMWQFGNAKNALYRDVDIEISDIKICYLSSLEIEQ